MALSTKWSLVLAAFMLFSTYPAFASPSYKSSAPGSAENSLQGWDGRIPNCYEGHLDGCWDKISLSQYDQAKTWYPVASLGAGAVLTRTVGQSAYFPIQDPTTDEFYSYTAQKPSQTGALFEIFLGSEWLFRPNWALQTGLDFDQVYTIYNANGSFTQGADAQSADQYSYNYSALTSQILAEGKLLYTFRNQFHPYLLLGLGAAINYAYSYNTSVPPFLSFTRQFSNNTSTSFSYAIGLGLDLDVSKEVRLGLGYRFTDLGKVALGPATINNIPVSGTISQNHLYSNIILVQLSFLF